jgi:hypothetical protein
MSDNSNVIPLPRAVPPDPFLADRARLTELLIRYCLIESYHRFLANEMPYPFATAAQLLPSRGQAWVEHRDQNTALMFLIDGTLPRPLNKHFRLRTSNRVTWRNIQRLAPDLDLSGFKASHCRINESLNDGGFETLLQRLIALDYALLAQQGEDSDGMALSHMHVKVERLTDKAIKELGKSLGYIERRLFERGEDYVEALEAKFFEYFGFTATAAGRKSAAAMAAQLLSAQGQRFSVFVAGQEDCRLTVLDQSSMIEQYLLIRPTGLALERFHMAAAAAGVKTLGNYAVTGPTEGRKQTASADGPFAMLYRLKLERTAAARPGTRRHRDRDLLKPWLSIKDAAVLPRPDLDGPEIPFPWHGTEE